MANEHDGQTDLHGRIAELEAKLADREAKLADREAYARFFEEALVMFCTADGATGRFTRVNPAWEHVLGWDLEQLYAGTFIDLLHPEDRAATLAASNDLRLGKPAIAFENRYRRKDGSYCHLRWYARVDADGTHQAVAQDISEQRDAEERARVYEDTILSSSTGMFVCHVEDLKDPCSMRLIMANEASERFTGVPLRAELGRLFVDVFPNVAQTGLLESYLDAALTGSALDLGEHLYGDVRVEQGYFAVKAYGLPGHRVCVNFENVTARRRAEAARLENVRQDEIIRAQEAMLAELSTPLIPVSDEVVVMPLIGAVDARRAEQVIATLLTGIVGHRAHTAILDITGISDVDATLPAHLQRATSAARLLGARVVLAGVSPTVARLIIEDSGELRGVKVRSTLAAALQAALKVTPAAADPSPAPRRP